MTPHEIAGLFRADIQLAAERVRILGIEQLGPGDEVADEDA